MTPPGRAAPSPINYPAELPITQRRQDLLNAIERNQLVVVAGETGSGKSTQLPKLCLELGRGVDGWIGHTQPRRIAARAVAERVAEELGSALGETVGYAVRFTDRVGEQTMVKVMTDGILLAEIQRDRKLNRYDTIIIDEAHERSLNIDFLLGYLAQLLPTRPDLKVIITSATIDTEKFAQHFDDAPIIEVSGRTYPVELRYRPLEHDGTAIDQVQGICDSVQELFTEGNGDVLVFCSGEREIRDAIDAISDLELPDTEILPLFARLSAAEQHRVFSRAKGRRVVVATNVAETSLTVPGIKYVVDTGTARISRYNRRTKVQRLPIEAISQASANQRSGRCGRIAPGTAIRLFAEDDYVARPEFTEPEIQRTNLASVILQMASLGLGDVESFPFVDAPDRRNIRDGIALLEELGAVRPDKQGTRKWLTGTGRKLAKLPIDPRLGRMLLAASDYGCLNEVLVIAAGLSIQDPRERPQDNQSEALEQHRRFADEHSDFVSYLNLWDYLRTQRASMSSSAFRRMCRREYLHYLRIREWQDVHTQLRRVAREIGLTGNDSPADHDLVHQAVIAGLLSHVGTKDTRGGPRDRGSLDYLGARNAKFAVAPGSALHKKNPKWVVAAEMVETTRLWARVVARVRPEWIEAAAEHLLKRSYSEPRWDPDRGAAVAAESVSLYGLQLVSGRTVMWDRIDEADARDLFIRHALVAGEWNAHHQFIEHNAAMVEEVRSLEARHRRGDLLVGDEALVEWFAERTPNDVTSVRRFDRWWKQTRDRTPNRLDFSLDDLLIDDTALEDGDSFPETWTHGDLTLPLSYVFDPSSAADGMTVDIPVGALGRIDGAVFDWLVPGLRRDLFTALVRSMPKHYRKAFVPIPETVSHLLGDLHPGSAEVVEWLRTGLSSAAGLAIPPDALDLDALPLHLRPNFRVVEGERVLATGGDLQAIKRLLDDQVRGSVDPDAHDLEQAGAVSWTFGEVPKVIDLEGGGHTVSTYPSLVDEGDSVALRLLPSRSEQRTAMWEGTRRLLMLNRPSLSKPLRALLTNEVKLALVHSPYDSPSAWLDDLVGCAVEEIMIERSAPAWNATDWDQLLHHVRDGLPSGVGRLGSISADMLSQVREIESALAAAAAPRFQASVSDIRNQLDSLVYPGFLTAVGARNLPNIRRYLAAIQHRLDRLDANTRRDVDAMRRVHDLDHEHDRLIEAMGWTPDLEAIMWQLQELRVSLFAQHLGTSQPVSETRVRETLKAVAEPDL